MKSLVRSVLIALSLFLFSGCVSRQSGRVLPGNDIGALKKYYVVRLPADTRGINKLIAGELGSRGLVATTGEAINVPADADAVVTYQDKWVWDMTMYMIQLDVQFRKPVSDVPMATGSCLRTSLIRKSPPEMVKEVLNQIFANSSPSQSAPMGTK